VIARLLSKMAYGTSLASLVGSHLLWSSYFEISSEQIAQDVSRSCGKPITQARSETASAVKKMRALSAMAPRGLESEVASDSTGLRFTVERTPKVRL
jgi:hypothetical protein